MMKIFGFLATLMLVLAAVVSAHEEEGMKIGVLEPANNEPDFQLPEAQLRGTRWLQGNDWCGSYSTCNAGYTVCCIICGYC